MQSLSQFLASDASSASLQEVLLVTTQTCIDISSALKKGSLAGILGMAGNENVQGEEQKKLDVISNNMLKSALLASPAVRAIASEEEDDIVPANTDGEYLIAFDPLDGSSNIDINSMVGTIFSIYHQVGSEPATEADFLQPGKNQVAAGYVLYGPSTMLVFTTGNGVNMFTLDVEQGEFILTRENVKVDNETQEFAINMSNQRFWSEAMQNYVNDLVAGKDGPRAKNFNMRWVAAMVGDVHRILCRGGIFIYPWDKKDPNKPGKLRLMYEANPMGMLLEQAGGKAFTHTDRILDIQPEGIHQRVAVVLGAANEVDKCLSY
ncbi:class 1 fructose-bisphosphatase [Marinomonas communis]|uniref:Fructose-1,6-bisphosphatase class 1 n=1 Tax=Marinomonas communis TaxID=28254 RepID=A0A4R6X7D2_9GAMM|nr:class 1 fructose-bisphosphatase [Marinomonas communis]TDR13839.1 D-fructose 1,6-bisphosphatase [Marinomonas communis]|tara:strand:- start:175 stop:1134 length:960 start_codon:yes stop_codon:yes gene_type:complete